MVGQIDAVMTGNPDKAWLLDRPTLMVMKPGKFLEQTRGIVGCLVGYMPEVSIEPLERLVESISRYYAGEHEKIPPQLVLLVAWEATLTMTGMLRELLLEELYGIDPGQAEWEVKFAAWRQRVEPGWAAVLSTVVAALRDAGKPLRQEDLSRHFGNETSSIKRPLASARKDGLLDHYRQPKGYWPTNLKPDSSWVRSVRTKTR
jgi:hypothetical protein